MEGIKSCGPKPHKTKQVALACTGEKVQTFRAQNERAVWGAARAKTREREPRPLSIGE